MENFDYKIFYGMIAKDSIWVRIFGLNCGISLTKTPLLFSERYGYRKYIKIFGWRIHWLKANHDIQAGWRFEKGKKGNKGPALFKKYHPGASWGVRMGYLSPRREE